MGNHQVQARISARVSRHNSKRDIVHDALWAEACARLRAVAEDPRYQPILLDSTGLHPESGGMTETAAQAAYDAWQAARGVPGGSTWELMPDSARASWEAAAMAVAVRLGLETPAAPSNPGL